MQKKPSPRLQAVLPSDVADRFQVVDLRGGPRFDFQKWGTFDMSELTVKKAEQLVAENFPYLIEKKAEPKAVVVPKKPTTAKPEKPEEL